MAETDKPTTRSDHNIAILGGGPAGLGAAWKLRQDTNFNVVLHEGAPIVGGNAASFDVEGIRVDYGSHRLHPVTDPEIMGHIKSILGDDLLLRPRHGRIRLKRSWIHFPLKPLDLATKLPIPFAFSLFFDAATAKFRAPKTDDPTFKTVLLGGLGKTMCESFYFPYVRKLWGKDPAELATTLAQRRVSGSSLPKLLKKIFGQLPGLKSPTTGKFYYPKEGFGQICTGFAAAAETSGAAINTNSKVVGLTIEQNKVTSMTVETESGLQSSSPDKIWSTVPISTLIRAAGDAVPAEVKTAAENIEYRGMILIYLVLDTDQFTEYDAHYFPEAAIPMSRMSEPKNYSNSSHPKGRTVLCAELPADPGDEHWDLSNEELGEKMREWIKAAGLSLTANTVTVQTRRLPYAYPVYNRTYAENFETMDAWVSGLENVLTFGRQGLFAHDNTHHALSMAYGAVSCLDDAGNFDRDRWAKLREEFETHVVED